jgi:hypothetical protein
VSIVSEGSETETPKIEPIPVSVITLPEKLPKSLFQDSNRLLALAAFVFSVVTGTFALVHTWTDSREATVDSVGKLIDQYYAGAEKAATLNLQTQSDYRNLLMSKQRSTASRAAALATRVENLLDDGIWLALAQINDNERNFSAAEFAWSSAADHTKDISVYLFGMRGLATNQSYQGKIDSVNQTLNAATKQISSTTIKGGRFINMLTPAQKDIELAGLHATQLFLTKSNDCNYLVPHFDEATSLLVSAYKKGEMEYVPYENLVIAIRQYLAVYKKRRLECAPSFENLRLTDDCMVLAEILDAAPSGFAVLRGGASQNPNEVFSRLAALDAEACLVTSAYQFYCKWPEHGEVESKKRSDQLLERVLKCESLGKATVSRSQSDNSIVHYDTTNIVIEGRQPFRIDRASSKDKFSPYWQVQIEVEPKSP